MPPPGPIVFDAYGTLFDPAALAQPLERRFPGRGMEIASAWRTIQVRHTWLRSLMGAWADFDVVTRDALHQAMTEAGLVADDGLAADLLAAYRSLPAYADVGGSLASLEPLRPRAVLTNGRRATVQATIQAAGLSADLPLVLSVDELQVYKPAPAVYALAAAHFGVAPEAVTFVSGNAWDCAGAGAFGFQVIRIRRTGETAELVGPPPVAVIDDLRELGGLLGVPATRSAAPR